MATDMVPGEHALLPDSSQYYYQGHSQAYSAYPPYGGQGQDYGLAQHAPSTHQAPVAYGQMPSANQAYPPLPPFPADAAPPPPPDTAPPPPPDVGSEAPLPPAPSQVAAQPLISVQSTDPLSTDSMSQSSYDAAYAQWCQQYYAYYGTYPPAASVPYPSPAPGSGYFQGSYYPGYQGYTSPGQYSYTAGISPSGPVPSVSTAPSLPAHAARPTGALPPPRPPAEPYPGLPAGTAGQQPAPGQSSASCAMDKGVLSRLGGTTMGSKLFIRPQMPIGLRVQGQAASGSVAQASPAANRPAYVSVPASSATTTQAAPYPTRSANTASSAGNKFPPAFQAWVERCFNRCRNDAERGALSSQLMQHVKCVEAGGRMWVTDWDTAPVLMPGAATPSAGNQNTQAGVLQQTGSKRRRWGEPAQADSLPSPLSGTPGAAFAQRANPHSTNAGAGATGKLSKRQRQRVGLADAEARPVGGEALKRAQRCGRFGDGRAPGGGGSMRAGTYQSNSKRSNKLTRGGWDDDSYSDESDSDGIEEIDYSTLVIKGTCTELEKSYFRLTSAPEPASVRPEHVLGKALARLLHLIRAGQANYFYAHDQFKGMRQDLTVQHVRNALSVRVYESHGRASLEYGDLAEFNQCQTQLGKLYSDGVPGCVAEFTGYRLLYEAVHARRGLNRALLHTMKQVPVLLRNSYEIQHALKARAALMTSNYAAFFAAYASAPHLGRAILDSIVPRVRWAALNTFVRAFKTNVPLSCMAMLLGFAPLPAAETETVGPGSSSIGGLDKSSAGSADSMPLPGCRLGKYNGDAALECDDTAAVDACTTWLQEHGAVVIVEADGITMLDVKTSIGKLSIPEAPKVAHGDENLSLNDFLSRAAQELSSLH